MPLVVLVLGAYFAGLLAGYADSFTLTVGVTAAAAFAARSRGRVVVLGLSSLAVAGVVVARTSHTDEAACVRRALHQLPVVVVVDDSVAPGAYVRAHLRDCEAGAALAVESGDAAIGSVVAARGDVLQSQRGLVVQHAHVVIVRAPGLLSRWRASAGRAIDRTFRGDAPLVRALLIADRHELSPEIRDRFAAAGLAHILAIAGLHIGIIAVAIELVLELAGVPRRRAAIITTGVLVFYVAVIGAPIPAVRSATMLLTVAISRIAQRPTSRWAIVAIGGSQPVIAPLVVLDAGYQLSVVGVVAMIAAGQFAARIGVHRLPWFAKAVAITLIGTTVATIASAPIVAWVFGRVSVAAPLTNLAAAPLIALAQPMLFCGLVLSPIPPLASMFADAAHPLLFALDRVARTAAEIPNASVVVAPTIPAAVTAGVLSFAVIALCLTREWTRPAIVASLAAAMLIWSPTAPFQSGMVELHMIDVGQGDALALRTVHGRWILFDAGGAWRGGDAGRSIVIPYVGRRGGDVDLFVLSHPHTDHVGGATSVLRTLRPTAYVDPGFPGPATSYRESLVAARESHVRWQRAHPGDSLTIDGLTITFLAPDSAWTSHLDDPNLASVVALVRVGEIRMLLMGDAEAPEEAWLLAHERELLRANILKVGHHGSKTSSSDAFLDAVRPQLALVSVGTGNTYHLPTPSIMRALAAHGAQVLRTDRLGTIVARTDGHRVLVEAAGDSWELPIVIPPLPPASLASQASSTP
ncbi:MAG TPA: DNA internalization-related competence protein ComEC/Rec2 [Gemmatimonadaceae bacterium]|nr:DNA internalization-related competence protein ComEC/Rec2 [Gemmatimonadaceae bacterium]